MKKWNTSESNEEPFCRALQTQHGGARRACVDKAQFVAVGPLLLDAAQENGRENEVWRRRRCSWYRSVVHSGRRFAPRRGATRPAAAAAACYVAGLLLLSLACNACFTCSSPALTNSGSRTRQQPPTAAQAGGPVSASAEG